MTTVSLSDTTKAAEQLQLQVQRALGPERRLLLAIEMSCFVRALATAQLAQQHPDWSQREIADELMRRSLLPPLLRVPLP